MTPRPFSPPLPKQHQRGAALITGLLFLVVLTLIGVTAMQVSGLEERMSGNLRDRSLAMQSGEMALRYAEQHILRRITGITGFTASCSNGLCYYGKAGLPESSERAWRDTDNCDPECPITYGSIAGVTARQLPVGVPAPTYLIEGIPRIVPGSGSLAYYYRITVRAQGAKTGTIVWLQEIFKPI